MAMAANSLGGTFQVTGENSRYITMGKRMPEWLDDDDFKEPNYDKLSDEELDELYYYGEIRSAPKPKKPVSKKAASQVVQKLFPEDEDDDWLDDDEDLYEDD